MIKATIARNPLMRKIVNNMITKMDGVFGYQDQRDINAWWDLDLPPHGVNRSKGTLLE